MHLQIEWSDAEGTADRFSWEPLSRINKDVPEMVRDYFNLAGLDLKQVLDEESNRRCHMFGKRGQNKFQGNDRNQHRGSKHNHRFQRGSSKE